MTLIYLLRHGETAWNAAGNRYCGRSDVELSETGRRQALAVSRALRDLPFAAIYCSPLLRSRQTAAVVAGAQALEYRSDDRLVEIDFGGWEGMTRQEIERDDPAGWAAWRRDPAVARAGGTGETGRQVADRVDVFLREAATAFPDATVMVVGHNTLNRLFLAASLGAPLASYRRLALANGSISVLEIEEGEVRWLRINDMAHLAGASAAI